ncbi:hypothetical protein OPT61_g3778 [Boeremia exigua]|uniref:Uncharacterized protein n=1 Tax=Boeremia exigua TaxID=749465 RepID=A0ACC2IGQ7_9PLEO|nr:hypothetical protein OPT61_g3778 [Boeremia exigua]
MESNAQKTAAHIDAASIERSNDEPTTIFSLCKTYDTYWWNVPHLRKTNLVLLVPLLGAYYAEFNNPQGALLGLLATMQVIGGVATLPIAPYLSDRLGRRHPIFIGSLIIIAGAALQAAAPNISAFLAARALLGVGGGLAATSFTPLIAELAYPTHRPIITALYNTSWYLGSIVAAWTTYGTFKMPNSSSWRIPSLLQALPSLIQLAFIYCVPESPRWLLANDRHDKAVEILSRYRTGTSEPDELVRFEVAEIQAALQFERTTHNAGYADFFKTAGNRRRLLICISLGFVIQWCGNGLVSVYLIQVLNNVGITDPETQNIINGVLQIFNYITAIVAALGVNRIGRRLLLLISLGGMFVSFCIWTGLSAPNEQQHFQNKGLGIGIVVLIFVFFGFYNTAMNPVPNAYLLEILPYTLRAKGLTIFAASQYSAIVFNGFANPIALQAISWRYYIVFVCLIVCWFTLVFFYYPETKNMSLEEVSVLLDGEQALDNVDDKVKVELRESA